MPIAIPRPQTPDSQTSSPAPSSPNTRSSSSHQQSSSVTTDVASSPELDNPDGGLKEFRPAPAFSIARAPKFPGWKPPGSTPPRNPQSRPTTTVLSAKSSPLTEEQSREEEPTPRQRFVPSKPLSPNHLVRIANALGVQAPAPHGQGQGQRSISASSRVPIGSGVNTANTGTRFLLCVIPPVELAPEGQVNSFRRGSLLPLHATLPSQLAAIAREFSLPSTVGLTVYLLDIKHDDGSADEYLGPRITEDTWKLLWSGMLRAERDEFERTMALQRQVLSPLSSLPGLPGSQSSPNFSTSTLATSPTIDTDAGLKQQPTPPQSGVSLRPLYAGTQRSVSPFGSSQTSTSAFTSRLDTQTTRSNTLRSESPSSIRTTTSAVSPLLPSLPIVGKIEFEIDLSKATWFATWSRRPRTRSEVGDGVIPLRLTTSGLNLRGAARRIPPSPLQGYPPTLDVDGLKPSSGLLTPASAPSPALSSNELPRNSLLLKAEQEGYAPLEEPEEDKSDFSEEALDEPFMPTASSIQGARLRGDPLGDVFPSDGETWSNLRDSDPNAHPDRAEYLSNDHSTESDELHNQDSDFQEVFDLLNKNTPPPLPVVNLGSPFTLDHPKDHPESPTTESVTSGDSTRSRRPAPLILGPSDKIPSILENLKPSPPGTSGNPTFEFGDPATPHATNFDDDDDYGLDEFETERAMQKRLDLLEMSITSLSPRDLTPESAYPSSPIERAARRSTPNMLLNGVGGPRFRSEALGAELASKMAERENSSRDTTPQPPRGPSPATVDTRVPQPPPMEARSAIEARAPAPHWPAQPFDKKAAIATISGLTPAYSSNVSEETRIRREAQLEEEMLASTKKYRPSTPAAKKVEDPMNSQTIITSLPPRVSSLTSPKSSRFSADSAASDQNDKSSSVGRSIRKLWRKSGASTQAAIRMSTAVKQNGGKDLTSPPPLPNNGSMKPDLRNDRPESSTDPFHFDQQQQARYAGVRPSPLVPSEVQVPPRTGHTKTRSILKGGRASQSQQPYVYDDKEKPSGLFQRRQSNRGSPPPESRDQPKTLSLFPRRPSQPEIFAPNQKPIEIDVTVDKQATRGLYSPPQNGGKLSPSAFPRTANSRSSFDLDDQTYRPSYESENPLTPRLSQFEMVSPPVKTHELDDDGRSNGWRR